MTTPAVGRWPGRIVEFAARLLPPDQRSRYAREFIAELHGMPRSQQLRHATQVLGQAWALRTALVAAGSNHHQESSMITTVRRPLKCRLRLHDWEEQENPETRERYEVCLRCNAYRDRGAAAPGTAAAGAAGGHWT